jgi:hypothetical protein
MTGQHGFRCGQLLQGMSPALFRRGSEVIELWPAWERANPLGRFREAIEPRGKGQPDSHPVPGCSVSGGEGPCMCHDRTAPSTMGPHEPCQSPLGNWIDASPHSTGIRMGVGLVAGQGSRPARSTRDGQRLHADVRIRYARAANHRAQQCPSEWGTGRDGTSASWGYRDA